MQVDWTTPAFDATPLSSDFGSVTTIRLAELKTAIEELLSVEHEFDYAIDDSSAKMKHKAGYCSIVNVAGKSHLSYPSTYDGALVYTNNADSGDSYPQLWFDTGVGLVPLSVGAHADLANLTDDGAQSLEPFFAHLAERVIGETYSYALASVSGVAGNNYVTGTGFSSVVNPYDVLYLPNTAHQKVQVASVTNTKLTFVPNVTVSASFGPVTVQGYRLLYASVNWINPITNLNMGAYHITGLPTNVSAYTTVTALADANASSLVVSNGGHSMLYNPPPDNAVTVHPNFVASLGTAKFGGNKLFAYKTAVISTTVIPSTPAASPKNVNLGWFSFWPSIVNNVSTHELHPEYVGNASVLDSPATNSGLSSYVAASWTGPTFAVVCIASGGGTLQAYTLSTGDN